MFTKDKGGEEAPTQRGGALRQLRGRLLGLIGFSLILLLAIWGWPALRAQTPSSLEAQGAGAAGVEPADVFPIEEVVDDAAGNTETEEEPLSASVMGSEQALIGLSYVGATHLFAYALDDLLPGTMNTGSWDDWEPAVSPDGGEVAFASNRAGQWDLYVLDLANGEVLRVNEDAGYDGAPTWSGDGSWLSYEHYAGDNLDIFIRPLDGSVEPVRISNHPGLDFAPAWSPSGPQIAFVSDRSGTKQIWLADLEASGEARFTQVAPGSGEQMDPDWSPDGSYLAWAEQVEGVWQVFVMERGAVGAEPRAIGSGEQPAWSGDGQSVLALVRTPSESYLTAYGLDGSLLIPPKALGGQVNGLAWVPGVAGHLLNVLEAQEDGHEAIAGEGDELMALADVEAPYPQLRWVVAPSFEALRVRAAEMLGWDALSHLEEAFVPLTTPPYPGMAEDWHYTGRAFRLHSGLLEAGWMQLVREDFGGQTFWRVYLRSAAQDGSQGSPMRAASWDFAAGAPGEVASGYWVDFTALAAEFGWERQPALANWRTYYPGARVTQFVASGGMSWEEAMLELYPADALSSVNP